MRSSITLPIHLLPAIALPALLTLACGSTALIPFNQGSSADRDDSDPLIFIMSVLPSTPGGACSPPRENSDFICKYELEVQVEYWLPERAMIGCTIYRGEEDVTSYGLAMEPETSKFAHTFQVSNFYEAMGVYTERAVCSVYETNLQGKILATDEQSFEVSLTTTWED